MKDTGEREMLDSAVRRSLVEALRRRRAHGGLTAAELADRVALHVTTVRFHLGRLEHAGLVVSESVRRGVGRPRRVYALPGDVVPTDGPHALLAAVLVETSAGALGGAPVSPRAAGARWAIEHVPAHGLDGEAPRGLRAKVGRVLSVLDAWGYAPEMTIDEGGRTATVRLSGCPFLPLAEAHPEVVCGIHHGLLAGALEAVGGRDATVRLRPFVEPRRCCAQISLRAPRPPRGAPA